MTNQTSPSPITAMRLNEILDGIEASLGKLQGGVLVHPEEILFQMDEADARLKQIMKTTNSSKAEQAQFEFVGKVIKKHAAEYVQALGIEKYRKLRAERQPDQERFWWYLDKYMADEQRKFFRTAFTWFVGIAAVVVVLVLLYNRFLAPDAATQKVLDSQGNAQQAMVDGDLEKAWSEVNAGLAVKPEDPDLLMYKGILAEKMGKTEEAAQVSQQVEKLLGGHEAFLLNRSLVFLQLSDFDRSQQDALEVIKLNPNSAEGYFYYGKTLEVTRKFDEAIKAYNKAGELANAQGKNELYATIRVNMGMLMQTMQGMQPSQAVTATP